jgi:septum formation protein
MQLVLCSVSPRRKVLLKQLGLKFTTRAPRLAEKKLIKYSVHELFKLTYQKLFPLPPHKIKKIFIAADTIVVLKNKILNKPVSRGEAAKFLKLLSGKTHQVMTALIVYDAFQKKFYQKLVKTKVTFRTLDNAQIRNYLQSNEYADKAGGYGIQGLGAVLVKPLWSKALSRFFQKISACFIMPRTLK